MTSTASACDRSSSVDAGRGDELRSHLGAGQRQAGEASGAFDCVVIDARPCSGSGSWRRKPDAKWRLTQKQFAQRLKDQAQVLEKGFELTKPGGTILYITCSVLPEENADQVAAMLNRHKDLALVPYKQVGSV